MDFVDAWAVIEKITTHDAKYALSRNANVFGRGLYEVKCEVHKDAQTSMYLSELQKLKKQVNSMNTCQLCQSKEHQALECPNAHQV